ncbi:hypothetical protein TWF694_001331 [Orbilia ellipsospora]|uniref:Uncharacterized protein n=1 Tax=Orbilia ellipsospora TaxID=2528407 RepID=A0AAV9XUL2_9PEZI
MSKSLSRFELLPEEIRSQIYKYVLDPEHNKKLAWERFTGGNPASNSAGRPVSLNTDILHMNRNIYDDAQYCLYELLGPVVTIQCNFLTRLFNFVYDRATWHRKPLPRDAWKSVCGRQAHLELTLITPEQPVVNGNENRPETDYSDGKEIKHIRWKVVIALVGMNNQGGEDYQLSINWTFNDLARSVLGRRHITNDHIRWNIRPGEDAHSYLIAGENNQVALDRAHIIYKNIWRKLDHCPIPSTTIENSDDEDEMDLDSITESISPGGPLRTRYKIILAMAYNYLVAKLKIWPRKNEGCLGNSSIKDSEKFCIDEEFSMLFFGTEIAEFLFDDEKDTNLVSSYDFEVLLKVEQD